MKKTNKSTSGTSFHQHTITATRQELIDALGEPDYVNGVEEKTQYEWEFETSEGDVFTIYDWKEYYVHDADVQLTWHIGGHSWMITATAKEEIQAALNGVTTAEDAYVDHDDDPEAKHWKGYATYLERNSYDDSDGQED